MPTDSSASHRVRARIASARRTITRHDLFVGLLVFVGGLAGAWTVAVVIEARWWLASGLRISLLVLIGLVAAGLFVGYIARPVARHLGWIHGLSDDAVALRIGRRFPQVKDRLLNLLQLLEGRHSDSPGPLVSSAADLLSRDLGDVDVSRVEDFSQPKRVAGWVTVPVILLLGLVLLAPGAFVGASNRLLRPASSFAPPPPFAVAVFPRNATAMRGADLTILATFVGTELPVAATLVLQRAGEEVSEILPLTFSQPNAAQRQLVNLRHSFRYRVESPPVQSPWYEVTVVDRPIIGDLRVLLGFPSYTRLKPEPLPDNVGNIVALPGTTVQMEAVVSGPQAAAGVILFESGRTEDLRLEGRRATSSFSVRRNDSYRLSVSSGAGIDNADPISYTIRTIPDTPPSIALSDESVSREIGDEATTDVRVRIGDDFGFSRLELYFRLAESRFGAPVDTFSALTLPLTAPYTLDQEVFYPWLLTGDADLDPVPGDVIEYYVQVWDNDRVSGPKSAKTQPVRLRLPSLTERYEELDEKQDDTEQELEEVLDEARRIREQFDALRDELRSKPESEWQDKRALEQIQKEQQRLEEAVDNAAQRIEEMTQDMSENNLVSEETLEMFEELRKVAEEVNTPELAEALRQIQEAMEQMNLQQMQQAMDEFEFDEEQYRQRMERTMELFKNLRVQQDLEEAQRRAEALAKAEEELQQRTEELESDESGDDPEATAQEREKAAAEQERAAEEMEQLEEKLEQIRERMSELKRAPTEEMQELMEQTQAQEMPESMRENAEQMRENELQDAQEGQQQMQQNLTQLQNQLMEMQQSMQSGQQQMDMAGLRRALDDVLTLSADEESLRSDVQNLASDSPMLRPSAQQQLRLSEGLSVVSDSLQVLSRSVPQMGRDVQSHAGEAIREMASATEAMTARSARRASGHQKGAMTHLNELALLLSDLLDQMMNGQGGSGSMSMQQMMQQLQDMAGQQQQINEQIQQLLNDMQGNRLSNDGLERLRQLGGEQERIRQQLKQLSRNRDLQNKALGDLSEIADQMQETIEELQTRRMSRQTMQRQQQILTRLLDASKSLQERGRERRRESRTGESPARTGPAQLTPSEQADRLRRDLIRALESGYAPDFEELIRRYFELLQQEESGN